MKIPIITTSVENVMTENKRILMNDKFNYRIHFQIIFKSFVGTNHKLSQAHVQLEHICNFIWYVQMYIQQYSRTEKPNEQYELLRN